MQNNFSFSRRELLARCGGGLGSIALASLLNDQGLLAEEKSLNPLAPKKPHFQAKAKAVIWIFINGGPSQVDTWDYKPELVKRDGQQLPGFDKSTGFFVNDVGPLMKSPFEFKQYGQCGKYISSIFPNLSKHVDKMAFIHSLWSESNNHSPALFMMNTGIPRMGAPSVGSWVTYGLGSENENLPGFVVMSDPKGRGLPKGHSLNWTSGFLPGAYQGTWLKPSGDPIENMHRAGGVSDSDQQSQIALMEKLNKIQIDQMGADPQMEARIKSFELAYRMQSAAPEALDFAKETKATQELYGIGRPECDHVAKQCLIARRLVERGVRFVQIYSGGMENERSWDGHIDIKGNHTQFAGESDQPVAALLTDLQQKGLLDSTLVIWAGEFGRLPISQKGARPGRDHNPNCNTAWMAGGGVKGGTSYGQSDDVGFKAAIDRADLHDFHATILHLLGLNHEKLTYFTNGRRYRLTDVKGKVIQPIIA
ncbi:DUF1501 domain-containing protein [Telmatocola sphagniphila]|uniref:DUF1501 domain-containing protein n=1 Tax=Telmatocola sphagniphila TaxID=1123043 RepID=A0A8E6B7M9_9BACT|nr:DUF1501 domain-containing protein [Telmatocola sphagniphila]QVL33241.1 DUF1501 domain-containing protein [Telmatocola sphagniphila]